MDIVANRCFSCMTESIVVPYELYELYNWGKVPELYGTLRILLFVGKSDGAV